MDSSNKRLAVNTIALYIKLTVSILVGIYSSRLVLQALGVSDFGLYNVVGGIVGIMNIVGAAMNSVVYRYISIEYGKGKGGDVPKIFSMSINIFVTFALLLLLIGYPAGYYYINHYLNIEGSNLADAHFVFLISLVTGAFMMFVTPYTSIIVAREKFIFTSVLDIFRTIIQFLLIIWMSVSIMNHLRLYTIIMMGVSVIPGIIHIAYNYKYNHNDIIYKSVWNLHEYREIGFYSIWIVLGAAAVILVNQGSSVLINSLWGLAVNASFGLATQVYTYMMQFVRNISQAASPQIMKGFEMNQDRSMFLVYNISRYSFYMFLIIAIPVILNIRRLLELWLVEVPEYLEEFVIFMLIHGMLWCLANGFDTSIQASGKIRFNQIAFSVISLSVLPLTYVCAKLGFPPYIVSVLNVFLYFIVVIMQCFVMKHISSFTIKDYLCKTIVPSMVLMISIVPYMLVHYYLISDLSFVVLLCLSGLYVVGAICVVGFKKSEKELLYKLLMSRITR